MSSLDTEQPRKPSPTKIANAKLNYLRTGMPYPERERIEAMVRIRQKLSTMSIARVLEVADWLDQQQISGEPNG